MPRACQRQHYLFSIPKFRTNHCFPTKFSKTFSLFFKSVSLGARFCVFKSKNQIKLFSTYIFTLLHSFAKDDTVISTGFYPNSWLFFVWKLEIQCIGLTCNEKKRRKNFISKFQNFIQISSVTLKLHKRCLLLVKTINMSIDSVY